VHLSPHYDARRKIDAAIFTAEDFVSDIGAVTKFIFSSARKRNANSKALKRNIIGWFNTYPPLAAAPLFKVKAAP
jgi:hypothetical protein